MWSGFCQKFSICSTYFELVSSKYSRILLHYRFAKLIHLFEEATPNTFWLYYSIWKYYYRSANDYIWTKGKNRLHTSLSKPFDQADDSMSS